MNLINSCYKLLIIALFNSSFYFKFYYIFFLEILEHIKSENHYTIIDKLLNLLNDDGYLFISTPNELDNPDALSEQIKNSKSFLSLES